MLLFAFFTDAGVPQTGLTPTIDVWESDGTQVVTAQTMTHVGGGHYKYDFAGYDNEKDYVVRADGGATLDDTDRYKFSSNEAPAVAPRVFEIDKADHNAAGTFGELLNTVKDEQENAAFGEAVYVSEASGSAGTTWPKGAPYDPVDSLTDARTIALARNLKRIVIMDGTFSLGAVDWSQYRFEGRTTGILNIGSATCSGMRCVDLSVIGTPGTPATIFFERCIINGVGDVTFLAFDCMLAGNLTIQGDSSFWNCRAYDDNGVAFYTNGVGDLYLYDYVGYVKFYSWTTALPIEVSGAPAKVYVDSTCTSGTLTIAGEIELDNQGTMTIDRDGNVDTIVTNAPLDNITGGSLGEAAAQASFRGAVWFSEVFGSSGTDYPQGTPMYPVDNEADARQIADDWNLSKVVLIDGVMILSQNWTNFRFEGQGAYINFNGNSVAGATFKGALGVYGDGLGDNNTYMDGVDIGLMSIRYVKYIARHCRLGGLLTLSGGSLFTECRAFSDTGAAIDLTDIGTENVRFSDYSGKITILNMIDAANIVEIDCDGAEVVIDATCTAGTVRLRGDFVLEDNSNGAVTIRRQDEKYKDGVYLSNMYGYAGTYRGIGARNRPSDNIADARTIADREGVRKYVFLDDSTYLLDQSYIRWKFEGELFPIVNMNGQSLTGTMFKNVYVIGDGAPTGGLECVVGYGTLSGTFFRSVIAPSVVVGDNSDFFDCYCDGADIQANDSFDMVNCAGVLTIKGLTAGQVRILDFRGNLTLDATCTGGTIILAGYGKLTDNSAGSTVDKDGWIEADAPADVWGATRSAHQASGSMGEAMRYLVQWIAGRRKVTGSPDFDMTVFQEDKVTPLLEFDLKDEAGNPAVYNVFEKDPK
jgi:hypothetical protein